MSKPVKSGGELFIVDNSDENWKGLKYLHDWTEIASGFDIATGFFEIGSLLALNGKWQKLDKICILMGNEVSARTRQAILDGLNKDIVSHLDESIEVEKIYWSQNTLWIDKDQTIGFKGVREDVWNLDMGGYQVCEKWLKDRTGRQLSADNRTHYQKNYRRPFRNHPSNERD